MRPGGALLATPGSRQTTPLERIEDEDEFEDEDD
jgi:hypothetical protein